MNHKLNIQSIWRGRCPLLGPALLIWVQGCPLRCSGCFNGAALDTERQCQMTAPEELAEVFLADPNALVLSGGEPFAQAPALAEFARLIRDRAPETPILAYTGYTLQHLLTGTIGGAISLLRNLDVLVDGPFQRNRLSDHPLRGSENQRVFLLGPRVSVERLRALDKPQIQVKLRPDGYIHLVGSGGHGRDMHELVRLIESHGVILE